MNHHRLKIINSQNQPNPPDIKNGWRKEAKAHFEHMWLTDPEQFDPTRNCMERERIERTWNIIENFIQPKDKLAADLACGYGIMSKRLKEAGAQVHALDITSQALNKIQELVPLVDQIYLQCLPHTTLEDDAYDLVYATEIIAFLPAQQLRLFMAELCRLVKPQGFVICSTPLDFNTQDPLLRFESLVETEFKIHQWICSHHRLYIRLRDFLSAPERYVRAAKNADYRKQKLQDRRGFSQRWFKWNSQGPLAIFWSFIQYISHPLAKLINQNRTLMLFLEKICRFFWGDSGISHAIFIASRRPLQPLQLPKDKVPIEKKGKRQVWE